jgi:hypothetical protein
MAMLILVKTTVMVATLIQFRINRTYYAEVLCVNKNRPELACHGKCVLMKRLRVEMEVDQKKDSNKMLTIMERVLESVVYIPIPTEFPKVTISQDLQISPWNFIDFIASVYAKGIFHPPSFC